MGENVFVLYNLPLYIIAYMITVQYVNKIMIYWATKWIFSRLTFLGSI